MSERHSVPINLKLNKEFLKWAYGHRLQPHGELTGILWKGQPVWQTIPFGGLHGTQFKSLDEAESLNKEFDKLLIKHKIDAKYKHSLMYFIIFLNEDYETQSLINNEHNRLIEYAQFILTLYTVGKRHFDSMLKNGAYQMIYDEATREYFFAKKELYNKMPLEELVEYVPDAKHADEVVRYMRISICNDELYLPPGVELRVFSNGTFKGLLGDTIEKMSIPAFLQYKVFTYTIDQMVQAHKKANTTFYRYLNTAEVSEEELRQVYTQYKKRHVSQSVSMLNVAIMLSDYLREQGLIKVKRSAAMFLFDYFSLFKAFTIKSNQTPPADYQDLPSFYTQNGINMEYIRLMLKDVGEN